MKEDVIGNVYGQLTVLDELDQAGRSRRVLCRCSCGVEKPFYLGNLRKGYTTSCGCHRRKVSGSRLTTHGAYGTPTHDAWRRMIHRCYNKSNRQFKDYGGRGISVCERWRANYPAFLYDMGEIPEGMSLDRIDTDGNYELSNCRWATSKQQNRNRRNNRIITAFGISRCMSEWAEVTGITVGAIHSRIKRRWTAERAVSVPMRGK